MKCSPASNSRGKTKCLLLICGVVEELVQGSRRILGRPPRGDKWRKHVGMKEGWLGTACNILERKVMALRQ